MGSINIFKQLTTFLRAVPLINLSKVDIFLFWKFFGECWESNPGQLGLEASMPTIVLCCPFSWLTFNPLSDEELQFKALIQFFIH